MGDFVCSYLATGDNTNSTCMPDLIIHIATSSSIPMFHAVHKSVTDHTSLMSKAMCSPSEFIKTPKV